MRHGIDLDAPELLDTRSWHWLRERVLWLWHQPSSDTRKAVPLWTSADS